MHVLRVYLLKATVDWLLLSFLGSVPMCFFVYLFPSLGFTCEDFMSGARVVQV